jgi:hypothetical protein
MSYMFLGRDAEEEEKEVPQEAAEPFDPIAALREQGITEASLPTEIELEEAPEESPIGATDVGGPLHRQTILDLSAYRTVDHPVDDGDTLLSPPPLSPAEDDDEGITPKDLIGATKPDLSLVPPAFLLYTSLAMMDGDNKYGAYNWREKKVLIRVYIAAAMRHLSQLLDGEDIDPVSGVPHIGHAAACLAIIADAAETGNLKDNRPKLGPAGDMIRQYGKTQNFDRTQ